MARRNDKERELWVNNDESLYHWFQRSRQGLTRFVREHRKEIDSYVDRSLNAENEKTHQSN